MLFVAPKLRLLKDGHECRPKDGRVCLRVAMSVCLRTAVNLF